MLKIGTVACLFIAPLVASLPENAYLSEIRDHLVIRDYTSAALKAKEAINLYPDSLCLKLSYLEALCGGGDEMDASKLFSSIALELNPATSEGRSAFEFLAWGVLSNGGDSSLLLVRLYSLLGAAFTQDARAVPILLKEMRGSNALLRMIAIKLAAQYGDASLREELLLLLKEEKVWTVRLEVIQAVGMLKMKSAQKKLQEIIASPRTTLEEKGAAILALAGMYDTISAKELTYLAKSNRAGLRRLACEIVSSLSFYGGIEIIEPLLQDTSPQVQIAAMKSFGLLQVKKTSNIETIKLIRRHLDDCNPEISITAAWLATLLDESIGLETFSKCFSSNIVEIRRLASAALVVTGLKGESLAKKRLKEESDPYAKINLAVGLMGQNSELTKSCDAIFEAFFLKDRPLWMWEERGFFKTLSPSTVRHREGIPRYPEMVDQLVRLELLSRLSKAEYPKSLDAIKSFLRDQSWGITGAAAAALIQEGGDEEFELISTLLDDPDHKIRVQAALILSMMGFDKRSVDVLIAAYPIADREMKMYILEALGRIGGSKSAYFLADVLKEPFQGLRVVAASAIIQCLYH